MRNIMSGKKKEKESAERTSRKKTFIHITRKVLLASIGAVALAQDEIEDFVNNLVERGEIAEKEGKNLMQEIIERKKKHFSSDEETISDWIKDILNRMDIPTKSDFDDLNQKLSTLSKNVDDLMKQ